MPALRLELSVSHLCSSRASLVLYHIMDKNAKRWKRYAEMPQEKKDELLRRQREASARRYTQMPQDKRDDLLRRRREANAGKKKNMSPPASDCVSTFAAFKRKRVDYTQNTP